LLKQGNKGFLAKIPTNGSFLATTKDKAKNSQFIDLYEKMQATKRKGGDHSPPFFDSRR